MELEDLAERIRDTCLEAVLHHTRMRVCRASVQRDVGSRCRRAETVELAPLLREFKQQSAD